MVDVAPQTDPVATTEPKKTKTSAPPAKASPTVRVDLERIERLVNLVGELVINQAMMSQSIAQENIHPNSPVFSGLDEFMQLTRNIQESVMMIRAQPVKSLFQRMSRIVRESSSAVDKRVKLVTEGENTEIDKTAIERLADPLTHMIRNAVDHGLESTETRVANGKSDTGIIRLSAAHRSGRVIIEVSDDGGGINRTRVRAKAVEKGLISEDANLTESEIDQLLFLPGFSTAAEVSNLSGRGVGMDVVKTQISALGGRISIESKDGEGSKFSISLPLTLAVLDGMVISVANETLVLPINAIIETLSLSEQDLRYVAPNQHVIRVRDKFVPVIDLGTKLGYRAPADTIQGSIALLISPEEGHLVALLVDQIEDQRQVVIKGLQDSYGRVPGVAAATILGDGQIALILDPADLVQTSHVEDVSALVKKVS
ncbi:MAG: chemotaxis protein CheA [Paracoccaceae bacterium]